MHVDSHQFRYKSLHYKDDTAYLFLGWHFVSLVRSLPRLFLHYESCTEETGPQPIFFICSGVQGGTGILFCINTQTVNIEARCQNTQFQCRLSWRCLIYSTLCIVCWNLTTNFIFKNDTLIKYVTGHALFELVLSLRYTITLTKTQLLFYLQNMSNATRLIFPTGSEYLCNLHKINSDRSR